MDLRPETILDIGIGNGKWGCLCYEYLHYWRNVTPIIDGIEIFGNYKSPAYGFYREVFYDSVLKKLDILKNYDLVMAFDIIEHLTREEGLNMLGKIEKHYLISTPSYWNPQGASFGNKYEIHISKWTESDFANSMLITDATGRQQILGWK